MKIYIILFLAAALFTVHMQANATGEWWEHDHPHEHESTPGTNGVNGVDGQDGVDGVDGIDGIDLGISSEEFAQGLTMGFAAAGMDFTSTTTKLQLGISVAHFDGENGYALGVARVIDSESFGDVLYSLKFTGCDGCSKNAVVGSAVWNVK